jgi:hypothetical protein
MIKIKNICEFCKTDITHHIRRLYCCKCNEYHCYNCTNGWCSKCGEMLVELDWLRKE